MLPRKSIRGKTERVEQIKEKTAGKTSPAIREEIVATRAALAQRAFVSIREIRVKG